MSGRPALIVFARAPVAGETKTRLIPALGPAGAAELYRCFLLDTLDRVRQVPAQLIVAAAGTSDSDPLRALVQAVCPDAALTVQSGADLGERMDRAVQEALRCGHLGAVVIGTDSPGLPQRHILGAMDLLSQRDLVVGPCLDGGYYLIALRRPLPGLFRDIPWSSDAVLVETMRRAGERDLSVALLEPWYDVDTPEDLRFLKTYLTALALAGEPILCPRTWQYVSQLAENGEI